MAEKREISCSSSSGNEDDDDEEEEDDDEFEINTAEGELVE